MAEIVYNREVPKNLFLLWNEEWKMLQEWTEN